MLGRIDMTDLWNGFTPLGEKPGELVEDEKVDQKVLNNMNMSFSIAFLMMRIEHIRVLLIDDEKYSVRDDNEVFTYRNPHNFRYFIEK